MSKKIYEDGIHDITNAEYHASSAISRSQLMLLDKSPKHFWYEVLSGQAEAKEETPAMKIGSLFHTLLLEPHKFEDEYLIIKQKSMPARGTNPYNLVLEEAKGRTIVTLEQFQKTKLMAETCIKEDLVQTLIVDSEFEKSIFWTDEETGLQFKARPDIWSEKMIVDLKTTADASPSAFKRSAFNYGYFLQAGMMFEAAKAIGAPIDVFAILACEKESPFMTAVFMMSEESLQKGIDQFNACKKCLKKCMDSNEWPGYGIQELEFPAWANTNVTQEISE